MNVIYNDSPSNNIKKNIFQLKPTRKDGLILQIHHTIQLQHCNKTKRIRFVCSAFNNTGTILANADINGNIFMIDFSALKYWSLPKLSSCSILSFSNLNSNELIIGIENGTLIIMNVHVGVVVGLLEGHKYPVKHVSFTNELCLTASLYEAFIFDMKTLQKVHELTLESQTSLKQILFIPVTHHIVACFSDDHIHVWNHENFETLTQILPTDWKKFCLKSIAFTRNGTTMILGGYSSVLVEFSLDSWTLAKILNLPSGINSVKFIDFISQKHDGGANRFLIILSNDGIIYFLDMEKCVVMGRIQKECEIISFVCSSNGTHLACILHSGEVNVYKIANYIELISTTEEQMTDPKKKLKLFLPPPKSSKEYLDLNKLRGILKEYGEYPEAYRSLIWSNILELPNNSKCYSAIIKKSRVSNFKIIEEQYPLISKSALKNLKKLLANLSSWCSTLSSVEFLPLFVFPFMKMFESDPVVCFEAIITIIINWCQHWFEYTPCPPVNVLAMIENVFIDHDNQLLSHLSFVGVTSQVYAWILLEVAFSEILTINEWCILWDHILSNEPSFLLMVVVAYNILCRSALLSMTNLDDFQVFYHNQNPIDIKKLISKSYYLLNCTTDLYHPRQYLNNFCKLPNGSYPLFVIYPKITFENQDTNFEDVHETNDKLKKLEEEVSKYEVSEKEKEKEYRMNEEEAKRLQQMEDIYQEKMLKEKERIDKQRLQLSKLRTALQEKQTQSLETSRRKIEELNLNERKRELKHLLQNVEQSYIQADLEIQKTVEDLSKHYMELMKQKTELEELLLKNKTGNLIPKQVNGISKSRQKLSQEMDEVQQHVNYNRFQNKVNIPMNISIVNDVVQELDVEIAKQTARKQYSTNICDNALKVKQMENDTKVLESDVKKLLNAYTSIKMQQAATKLTKLSKSV